jgi:hypothetical protein
MRNILKFICCALAVAVVGSALTHVSVDTLFGAASAGSAAGAALSTCLDALYA